jgi:prepilin-type N-terminal cleavage/methylation domain-containing protein
MVKPKESNRWKDERPSPASNGQSPENQFDEAARLLRVFCDGLGSVVWRFTQLEKAFQTRAATLSSVADQLRHNMDKLDRLHHLLDAELRRPKVVVSDHGERRPLRMRTLKSSPRRKTRGFTLVELLVVIAIIGILAALLMTAVSRAKNQASKVTDINNLKQVMTAVHSYVADENDVLPPPNWDGGGDTGTNGGWLYAVDLSAMGPARFKAETGLLWSTLHTPKVYVCPMDDPTKAHYSKTQGAVMERPQQLSSYAMNGAVVGYMAMIYPPVKMASMHSDDCAFWETDETDPFYFNDGANFPEEGVSARHQQGAIHAAFDGAVSYVRLTDWYALVGDPNRNRLWCYPGTPDGR